MVSNFRTVSRAAALVGLLAALAGASASAQTLRFGLAEDPDVLDPTLARTFVGRIVFASLCDKLFDIDEKLNIVPQLATGYEWSADNKALVIKLRNDVVFHDGEKMDAAAVKFNIERHKNMAGSNRRGELAPVASVDVVDNATVRLNLSAPFSPLLAQLADRAGMMVSPKAAQAAGDKFGAKPVCSGPFRFVERVAQDKIVVERFPSTGTRARSISTGSSTRRSRFDRATREPALGQLDFIERLGTSDVPQVKGDPKLKLSTITELGYQGITINVGKSEQAQKNPLGKDPRVREAFELSLDREGIVAGGAGRPGGRRQPVGAAVEQLLREERADPEARRREGEGAARRGRRAQPELHADDADRRPTRRRSRRSCRRWPKEAGFDVKIQSTEFATSLNMADKGEYEAYVLAWSGRADPTATSSASTRASSRSTTPATASPRSTTALNKARSAQTQAERMKFYTEVAQNAIAKDRPIIYVFHRHWLWRTRRSSRACAPCPMASFACRG
jgi:peptide/nickel transport system substrate-binding protein